MTVGLSRQFRVSGILLALGVIGCLSGCGYRVAGSSVKAPDGFKTLTIQTLGNKTKQHELEQVLTRALIEEFSERSAIKVNSQENAAGAVLNGDILSFTSTPMLFSTETFATTFLVTLQVSLRLTQDGGKKVLYENPNLVFRDQYVINTDQKQYFPEVNSALRRIARDFAASVATAILSSW